MHGSDGVNPRGKGTRAALLALALAAAAAGPLLALADDDPAADLAVTLEGPSVVAPGGGVAYALRVRNAGPEAAPSVVVTDALPGPLAFAAASGGGAPMDESTVRWRLGTLLPGEQRDLMLYASVPVTASVGRVVNRAGVTSATADPDPANNEALHGSDVVPVDVRVEIETEAFEARPGDVVSHTVRVANASVVRAEGVLVALALSPHARWASDDATSAGNGFTRSVGTDAVRWHRPALEGPESREIQLVTRVLPGAAPGATLVHTVTVSSVTRDGQPTNNTASALAIPVRSPDLWVTKSGPAEISRGGEAQYTLRYGNRGPATAPSVAITDTLTAELTFESATPPGTAVGQGAVRWDVGDLPPGSQGLIRLWARLPQSGPLGIAVANEAVLASRALDLAPADNRAVTTATVTAGAPETVAVRGPDSLTAGGPPGEVQVRVSDAAGNPAADGTAVMMETTRGLLGTSNATTRGGLVTTTLAPGTVAGTARVTARAGAATAYDELEVLPAALADLELEADPAVASVDASVTLRIRGEDRFGNPVRDGTLVLLQADHGSTEPALAATGGGVATATWVNRRSGTATVTASSDAVTATATATFLPGAADTVRLEAAPAALPVVTGRSTITATVTDRHGNPVADGTRVDVTAQGGSVMPGAPTTVAGTASTTFAAGAEPGAATVKAVAGGRSRSLDLDLRPADLVLAGRLDGPRGRARESRTYPGEPLTYTVAVRNEDMATAGGVYLALGLPTVLLLEDVQASAPIVATDDPPPGLLPEIGPDYTDRAWMLPDLADGDTITVTATGRLDRGAPWPAFETLFARSVVTTTTAEASSADLIHSDQAAVHAADHFVQVALNYGASAVQPGGRLLYDISFGNKTSGTDGRVWITNTVPAHTSFDRWEPGFGTTIREARPFLGSSRQLVWEVDGDDALSGSIRLWLAIDSDAPTQTVVRNAVRIGASVFDHDESNNVAEDGGVWLAGVNLSAIVEAPESVAPGEAATFRLRVRNDAQRDTATNVEVVARPPAGTRLVATEPPALLTGDGRLSWRREVVASGGEIVLDATFEVPESAVPGSRLTYDAVATSDQLESYPADNNVTASVPVVAGPAATAAIESTVGALVACTTEEAEVTATFRDRFGNVVTDGTRVSWSATGLSVVAADTRTANGSARAVVRAGRVAGPGSVRVAAGAAVATAGFDLEPSSPVALAVTADPRIVPRGGRTRISVGVLDGCGNVVADGWPIELHAERGAFDGGGSTVTRTTVDGSVGAKLRVDETPGGLRVTARHAQEMGETVVTVLAWREGLYVPYAGR